MASQIIIACNAGSSSYKLKIFRVHGNLISETGSAHFHWQSDKLNFDQYHFFFKDKFSAQSPKSRVEFFDWLSQLCQSYRHQYDSITIVHRVVHGGTHFNKPILATREAIKVLHELDSFAPLHQPANLNFVENIFSVLPDIPQVLCFDTAFHQSHDKLRKLLPIPKQFKHKGMIKYGFHGLSYEYIVQQLQEFFPHWHERKIVIAHLGSGASVCAIRKWRSIDSSMGLSALDGLPMATRPGSIDPGVLLHLLKIGYTHDDIESVLYRKSGLVGISGISGDISLLIDSDDKDAQLAVDYFCWKTAQGIAQMAVSLNGLEGLIFTGGIGENIHHVLIKICESLAFLNVEIPSNFSLEQHINVISNDNSPINVLSIKTNEELLMAQHCLETLNKLEKELDYA